MQLETHSFIFKFTYSFSYGPPYFWIGVISVCALSCVLCVNRFAFRVSVAVLILCCGSRNVSH